MGTQILTHARTHTRMDAAGCCLEAWNARPHTHARRGELIDSKQFVSSSHSIGAGNVTMYKGML